MSGSKRSNKVSFGKDDYYDMAKPSSSKRAKREQPSKAATRRQQESTDFEIDHEVSLEPAKQRRGAVATDAYVSDDEEVGGGAFSSDSDNGGYSDNDEAKLRKKPDDDDEDFDMFSSTAGDDDGAAASTAGKGKNNKGKKKRLGLDDIEGQELDSRDQESDEADDDDETKDSAKSKGNKLTAFNMQQEMEEGSFDAQGNYIRNTKDPEAFHDKWMEGISKKDMVKAKQAQFERDQAEKLKEATRQSTLPQTQADVYRILVEYLLPGESVKDALTVLGKGAQGKIPLWKQKLLAKKNKNKKATPNEPVVVLDEQQAADRQRKVEEVTGLADQLMALGHFTVYEDTFETMVRYLRSKMEVDEYWVPQSSQRK